MTGIVICKQQFLQGLLPQVF